MIADKLIARLDGVRSTGADRWRAICPAHESRHRSTSLSIREDGDRLLIYCFAGCETASVLAAIGLSLADLYPERIHTEFYRTTRAQPLRPNHYHAARDALLAVREDVLLVAMAGADILEGRLHDEIDRAVLLDAVARIRATAEVAT